MTKNAPAPFIYRKWCALALVAAVMTRRLWFETKQGIIYPNFIALMVGDASTGKGPAIDPTEKILWKVADRFADPLKQFEGINIGPGDATVAGLMDEFIDPTKQKSFKFAGKKTVFTPVVIVAEELAAFMHDLDTQMMGYMVKFLNCQNHSQRLRSQGETVTAEHPLLHVIGGVQPKMLSQIIPSQAFGMGLTARIIFVYSDQPKKVSPFSDIEIDDALEEKLVDDLAHIVRQVGRFKITNDAKEFIEDWWMNKADKDKPKHPRLVGNAGKRIFHMFRLSMVHSIARHDALVLELRDVKAALTDLLEVESFMPKMFEDMTGEMQHQDVFGDLAHQVQEVYSQTKRPIPYHTLTQFAARKVKSYEIVSVIDSLLTQQLIQEVRTKTKLPGGAPKCFIPGEAMQRGKS